MGTCSEPCCDRPCWTVGGRGRQAVCSSYCYGHSNLHLIDAPSEPAAKPRPASRLNGPAAFRAEVRRQSARRGGNGAR